MKILQPGSVIGVLGGGQLGRMTAMAAARLGYDCHIFCPEKEAPALAVSAYHTCASFDDLDALTRFAKSVDVVTLEWENVPLAALAHLSRYVDVFPGKDVLSVAQDRFIEKTFVRDHGAGTAHYIIVHSEAELIGALNNFPLPCILKSTRMGYDGKGQVRITRLDQAVGAWKALGSVEGILESFVNFTCEISVIVARRADGVMAVYPVVENRHINGVLDETIAPAVINSEIAEEAQSVAVRLTDALGVVGLLAVEFFVLPQANEKGQYVLVNEIAPRPHNSGHWTMDACSCSQFEQLVRSICGLPLGNTIPHSKAVMKNILGTSIENFQGFLSGFDACLHLYGKKEPKEGRKMGHVTFLK